MSTQNEVTELVHFASILCISTENEIILQKLAFFAHSSKIRDRILKFHRVSLKIEMTYFFFFSWS